MPLVSASEPHVLVETVRRLRSTAAYHKQQVGFHREELGKTKASLAALEADCLARGIPLTDCVPRGEGDIHGPDDRPRS